VQRDKKLVSFSIVDKQGKPYVSVKVNDEDKVRHTWPLSIPAHMLCRCRLERLHSSGVH
jgi:hypothetical protein